MFRVAIAFLGVALAVPCAASAKGGLLFDRTTAQVGDPLVLSSPWEAHPTGTVVYLLPLADSPRFWPTYQALWPASGPPPRVASAVRLGRTKRFGENGTMLAFRVPRVKPGRYVLGFWCIPCDTHWTSALPNYQLPGKRILHIRPRN